MTAMPAHAPLTARLADALYTEAMLLADEMRSYFEGPGMAARATLDPAGRVLVACESLNATTRLMQAIAWLLVRRAVDAGDMATDPADAPARRLGEAPPVDPEAMIRLEAEPRRLIEAGADLHARVRRLAAGGGAAIAPASPARSLIERLERAF